MYILDRKFYVYKDPLPINKFHKFVVLRKMGRCFLYGQGGRKSPVGVSRSATTYLRRTEIPFIERKGSRRQNQNAFRSSSSRPVANLQVRTVS